MKKLQILGTGCPKCRKLAENVQSAAEQLGIDYELQKVTDVNEIMRFGVIVVSTLPMMLVYPFVQRHFIRGIMIGSVKG